MMNVKNWLLGGVAVLALVGAAAFALASGVGAQEGAGAEESGRTGILDRVAANLGIDVETLRDAFHDARLAAVDDALSEGRITEQQAAQARERIEEGKPPLRHVRAHVHHYVRRMIVESAAMALGITPEELRDELRSGNSIAGVAEERGESIDDVKAQIVTDAEAKLAELVAADRIDESRADDALAKLQERLDDIVSRVPAQH